MANDERRQRLMTRRTVFSQLAAALGFIGATKALPVYPRSRQEQLLAESRQRVGKLTEISIDVLESLYRDPIFMPIPVSALLLPSDPVALKRAKVELSGEFSKPVCHPDHGFLNINDLPRFASDFAWQNRMVSPTFKYNDPTYYARLEHWAANVKTYMLCQSQLSVIDLLQIVPVAQPDGDVWLAAEFVRGFLQWRKDYLSLRDYIGFKSLVINLLPQIEHNAINVSARRGKTITTDDLAHLNIALVKKHGSMQRLYNYLRSEQASYYDRKPLWPPCPTAAWLK